MSQLDEKLTRLDELHGNEDVRSLSYAKYPGTHCPLFGVSMLSSMISDLAVLVVGTGECTYYAKGFAQNMTGSDRFYSLVIGSTELTFGSHKVITAALRRIQETDHPRALMLVTTCVLEVIGEDTGSLLDELQPEFDMKLLLVKTEHFKCGSHIPGMERMMTSLAGLMAKRPTEPKSINILGHRKKGVEKTEVIAALATEGVTIKSVIPSASTIDQIREASSAALNVVTDFTALPLAREMEKRFGIPFVYFGRHLTIERIDAEYRRIDEVFGTDLYSRLASKRQELAALVATARDAFSGKTFIYGNTPMMAFEVSDYLCSLGMKPLFIQIREYYEEERGDMDRILARGENPYIAQLANIAPMQAVYDLLKPNFYIGHENPMALMQKGIIQVTADEVIEKIGYEVPLQLLHKLLGVMARSGMQGKHPVMPSGIMPVGTMPAGMMAMSGMMGMGAPARPAADPEEQLKKLEALRYRLHNVEPEYACKGANA